MFCNSATADDHLYEPVLTEQSDTAEIFFVDDVCAMIDYWSRGAH
jgi:hypothetical protein